MVIRWWFSGFKLVSKIYIIKKITKWQGYIFKTANRVGELPFQGGKGHHKVIIIEINKAKIDKLSEEIDCSFLQGDGSQPNTLREVNPTQTDFLFCLSSSDQANVIASLIGRSLGFKRIVTSISDPQFEGICHELGLKDTIIPSRTLTRYLVDMVGGSENINLSTIIKYEARIFILIAGEEEAA